MSQEDNTKLLSEAMGLGGLIYKVRFSLWRGMLRLQPQDLQLGEKAATVLDHTKLVKLGRKSIVDPKWVKPMLDLEASTHAYMKSKGRDFFGIGIYVPNRNIAEVEAQLAIQRDLLRDLAAYFVENRLLIRQDARRIWRELFEDMGLPIDENLIDQITAEIPESARQWKMSWFGMPFSGDVTTSTDITKLFSEDILKARKAVLDRVAQESEEFVRATTKAMREELIAGLQSMTETLTDAEKTHKKVNVRSVEKLSNLVKNLQNSMPWDDKELSERMRQILELCDELSETSAKSKNYSGIRADFSKAFADQIDEITENMVMSQVDVISMMTGGKRQINPF